MPSGQSVNPGRTVPELGALIFWLKKPALGKGLGRGREGAYQGPSQWSPSGMPPPRCRNIRLPLLQTPKLCQYCWEPGLIPRP